MQRYKGPLFLLGGLAAGILLGLAVLFAVPSRLDMSRPAPPATGKSVPDFTLQDVDGKSRSLKSMRGTPLVINFWATWCAPCRQEMPLLNDYAKKLTGRVEFWAVNNDEASSVVQPFVASMSISFPVLLDPGGKINGLYYVQSYPNTLFIDSNGILRAQHIGQLNEALLIRGLEAVEVKP